MTVLPYIILENRDTDINNSPEGGTIVYVKNGAITTKSETGVNQSQVLISKFNVDLTGETDIPEDLDNLLVFLDDETAINYADLTYTYEEDEGDVVASEFVIPATGIWRVQATVKIDNSNPTDIGDVRNLSILVNDSVVSADIQAPVDPEQTLSVSDLFSLAEGDVITFTLSHDSDDSIAITDFGFVIINKVL